MKYVASIVLLVFAFSFSFGVTKTIKTSGKNATEKVTGTYADSQVDSVWFTRQDGMSALSFQIYVKDSVSITDVIIRRVFQNTLSAVAVGDTLYSSYTTTAAGAKTAAITLAPLAEQYIAIVTYAGSANGVTTPTVYYGLGVVYNK